jgi:hypothetical protein
MNEAEAIAIIQDEVGLPGIYTADMIDGLCREAASARAHMDWPEDLQWRTWPHTAAKRVTLYLDSFNDD